MILINKIEQLEENLETVEHYLTEGTDFENEKMTGLLRAGACYMAYEVEKELRFAPSRFIGYVNNNLTQHFSSHKDGRETNVAISRMIDNKLGENPKLEKAFLKYCRNLGIEPYNKKRKYWKLKLTKEFKANSEFDGEFPEGKIAERKHKYRERNSKVTRLAKQHFKEVNGHLFCQICGFDFENEYGKIGKDFIEAHHTTPISEMKKDHKTKIEDIAILCANCHRMTHRRRPWLRMKDMKKLWNKNKV
jgi:5-methylcytosine-specific restriction protein A